MSRLDGNDDLIDYTEMNKLPAPKFKTCEEEAALQPKRKFYRSFQGIQIRISAKFAMNL